MGGDQLNFFLLGLGLLFMLVSSFIPKTGSAAVVSYVLHYIPMLFYIAAIFRMFSKNIYKRRAENAVFMKFWGGITRFFSGIFKKRADSATHVHFKCPACRQQVRVPRGKGKISITCPKCSNKFIKKT
jgi:DNA-directed RNA polymerase subunit RPC12/RpoP